MKIKSIITSVTIAAAASAQASISLEVQFIEILNSASALVPLGSKAILVVSQSDTVFGNAASLVGLNLSAGTVFATDDKILRVFTADDSLGARGFADTFTIDYVGLTTPGDQLALYWFPTITSGNTVGNSTSYGFYRNSSPDLGSFNDPTNIGFVLPADTLSYSLAAYDAGNGGAAIYIADQTTPPAVPEPSTYAAILGLVVLGVAIRKRK